jgi:hypothetical protein
MNRLLLSCKLCRIFQESRNCLFDARDTDTCHIKAFPKFIKFALNILKTLYNYSVPVSAVHKHSSEFVNRI